MQFIEGVSGIIVRVPKSHEEKITTESGLELVHAFAEENQKLAIKQGEVVTVPRNSEIPIGATAYFNDTILDRRPQADMKFGGVRKNFGSEYQIDEEHYYVPYVVGDLTPNSLVYGFDDGNGFKAINGWVFCRPVYEEMGAAESGLILLDRIEGKQYQTGEAIPKMQYAEVVHPSHWVSDNYHVKPGDVIYHEEGAEYPYEIDGETLYRVHHTFLLAKIDDGLTPPFKPLAAH